MDVFEGSKILEIHPLFISMIVGGGVNHPPFHHHLLKHIFGFTFFQTFDSRRKSPR